MINHFSAKTPGIDDANKIMKHRVTMVGWDLNDTHVVTAVNDLSLRVWDSYSGKQVHELVVSINSLFNGLSFFTNIKQFLL